MKTKRVADHDKKFLEAYEKLNSEQKTAVDTIYGPVFVVAGPGTGKTQILTLRIANIIRLAGADPESILAVTFTDAGAHAMKKRLASMIGNSAYSVKIETFHAFADRVIKKYPEYFGRKAIAEIIDEVEKTKIAEEIAEALLPKFKKISIAHDGIYGEYRPQRALQRITEFKKQAVTPDVLERAIKKAREELEENMEILKEMEAQKKRGYKGLKKDLSAMLRRIEFHEDILLMYREYLDYMDKNNLMDFDDLLVTLKDKMSENENLLMELREENQFILVDEHQDTNKLQYSIIKMLASHQDDPDIFVVGDEKQSIYRFQGADLGNFEDFAKMFPRAKKITLTKNYRSLQPILDCGHEISSAMTLKVGNEKLSAQKDMDKIDDVAPMELLALSDSVDEALYVAHRIKENIDGGIPPEEIAVLSRSRAGLNGVARELKNLGIKYSLESPSDLLSYIPIMKLANLIDVISHNGIDDKNLAGLILSDVFVEGDRKLAIKIIGAYKKSAGRYSTLMEFLLGMDSNKNFTSEEKNTVKDFTQKLARIEKLASSLDALSALKLIIAEFGFLEDLKLHGDKYRKALNAFMSIAKNLSSGKSPGTVKDLADDIRIRRANNIGARFFASRDGGVLLTTAHKSKGLEFDVVYLPEFTNKNWKISSRDSSAKILPQIFEEIGIPAPNKDEEKELEMEDAKRLFYVAITRAKRKVIMTYHESDAGGKEMTPSPLLEYLDISLVKERRIEDLSVEIGDKNTYEFSVVTAIPDAKNEIREILRSHIQKRGVSVTMLNNFSESPWLFLFRNILKIPDTKNYSAVIGSAFHRGAECFLRADHHGNAPEEVAYTEAIKYLNREYVAGIGKSKQLMESELREMIGRWLAHFKSSPKNYEDLRLEMRIGAKDGVFVEYGDEEIGLTGIMDRLAIFKSGGVPAPVTVTDYKTSEPKGISDRSAGNYRTMFKNFEYREPGKSETAKKGARYYRQLVFYGILLDSYGAKNGLPKKYDMISAELEFVPVAKGKDIRVISKTIPEEDKKDLRALILEFIDNAWNLKFYEDESEDNVRYLKEFDKYLTSNISGKFDL